jgi:hypothetical protein
MSRHISGDGIVVVETRRRWMDEERYEAVNCEEDDLTRLSVVGL